jgi:hypothetical protein
MNQLKFTFLFISFLSLGACTYENEAELFELKQEVNQPPQDSDTTEVISFNSRVKPILSASCNSSSCHGAGTGPGRGDFSAYEGVKAKVDNGSFENRVIVRRNMPPSSRTPLSEQEIQDLKSWIDAGAPNN